MEKKTMGSFLAALRRANGMTQKELAERLNVSDKSVSRWERDDGAPDLALIPVIAEVFGVTCDELLRGVQLKITAIQIALFLRIPINEPFLKELYHMYASSSSSTVATLPCFRSTPTPAPPRRFSRCTGFRSLSRSVSTTRRRSCAGWRRSAANARPWRCWRS